MKDFFETILIIVKIFAASLAAIFFFVLVFKPTLVAKKIEEISNGLAEVQDTVEYSVFFFKVTKEGTAARDILALQQKLEKATATIVDRDSASSKKLAQQLSALKNIFVGQEEKVSISNAWIVLAGSANSLDSAILTNQKIAVLYPNTDVILAAGRYRSVVVFQSSLEAKNALKGINEELDQSDSYVRLLSGWCDDHVRSGVELLTCDRTKQLQ